MNQFVWADLSTYDTQKAKLFYEGVFDWKFQHLDGYFIATDGISDIAGMYETPDVFKAIKMPHFWMSYVGVSDVLATANRPKGLRTPRSN